MKNYVLVLTSVALTMVYSCSQKESTLVEERFEDVPLTVKATMADKPDSKTVLEDGNVLWTSGDAINLFFSNQSSGQFTTNIDEPSATAEFTGTLSVATGSAEIGTTGKAFWAVYPYNQNNTCDGSSVTLTVPSTQASLAGSFADKLNPSVATSPGLDLAFYNVCAPFYFSVTQSGVTSATFRGNNNEDVAGQVRVTMDSNGFPVAEVISGQGAKSITINAPNGGFVPGTTYVLVLLPQTLSAGYTLTFHKGDAVAECVVSKNAEFIGSQGRSKMNADEGLIYIVPDTIDLGLSVKWRNRNIGANNPEDCGNYYAWGETETKENYSWPTYKWYGGYYSDITVTKYNTNISWGTVDNKTVLEAVDDIACVELGSNWRVPTDSEINELISTRNNASYQWKWTSINGVYGYQITYLVNNQSLFLPTSGMQDETDIINVGDNGHYWSSSLYITDYTISAWSLYIDSYNFTRTGCGRCAGLSVRPVYSEIMIIAVESIELNKTELNLLKGISETLIATINPDNATDKTVTWTSSDTAVASVENGMVTAIKEGAATITAQAGGQTATCTVVVYDDGEYVDLGLSVNWASKNLGAENSYGYGDYYAWGEVEPYYSNQNPLTWKNGKEYGYDWSSYRWCNGSASTMTKYCINSSYGTVDNKTVLDPEDDVAYVKLGGSWRVPTEAEWTELRNNCTWAWTSDYNGTGIAGMLVTSNVAGYQYKSIFLPAAGSWYTTNSPTYPASDGRYWSSSLFTEDADYTFYAVVSLFYSGQVKKSASERFLGYPIRPIKDKGLEDEIITDGTFTGDANSLSMTTASGITISQLKNNGNNCNTSFNTVSTLRIYKNNQIQFTGKTFKSIEMYYTGSYSGSDWTIIDGGGTVEIDTTNKKVVWENPDGASVVTLQNSGTSKNVQLRTTEFVITYE